MNRENWIIKNQSDFLSDSAISHHIKIQAEDLDLVDSNRGNVQGFSYFLS